LLDAGHAHARSYPVAVAWAESDIVRRRRNQVIATEATLIHSAMADMIGGKGKFEKNIERLNHG
jgi:flagellar motor switch protein FliM